MSTFVTCVVVFLLLESSASAWSCGPYFQGRTDHLAQFSRKGPAIVIAMNQRDSSVGKRYMLRL